jgi:chemotaxis protein MotB
MADEEHQCEECKPGLPAWMGTFADLMSLLMCFFVLLLSFAEMDVLKFKRLAGSMRQAFGVQQQVDVNAVPKGTSVIALEFSPGKPQPTPIKTVMQQTTDADKQTVELMCDQAVEKKAQDTCDNDSEADAEAKAAQMMQQYVSAKIDQANESAENQAIEIASKLEKEIAEEIIEIESNGRKIIIRVEEKGSFASGSAELEADFLPVLDKLVEVLASVSGRISVEGHTDDIPIKTKEFPSNWDLSVKRALTVAEGLLETGNLDYRRFSVSGFADTKPLVANEDSESRAKNRRVEIVLREKTNDMLREEIEKDEDAVRAGDTNVLRKMLELQPEEIF